MNLKLTKQQRFDLSAFRDVPIGGGTPDGLVIGANYKLKLGGNGREKKER